MSLMDDNWLTFNILVSTDVKYSVVLDVREELSFVLEDLPPVGVGAVDLHLVGLSRACDVP